MSAEQTPSEPTRSTIVSRSPGMAYERMRDARRSLFDHSLVRTLTVQGALLGALAAALALTLVAGVGPTAAGAPEIWTVGAGGGLLVTASVAAIAGVGTYRLRREPLTEREALRLLVVEDAATYAGVVAGGLLVAATVVVAVVEVVTGGSAVAAPTTSTAAVAAGATVAAVLALAAGQYFRGRLPRTG